MEPLSRAPRDKLARKLAIAERALNDLQKWVDAGASEIVPAVSQA